MPVERATAVTPVEKSRERNGSRERYESVYAGAWEVRTRPREGPDPGRLCLLFSGQGGAFPGMFRRQYEHLAAFRDAFDEVDAVAVARDLPRPSRYLLGDEDLSLEDLPAVRNLAQCTVQVALFRSLPWSTPRPAMLSGYSQGELPALTAAGILDLTDMAAVLIARERACPPPFSDGRLIAAGGDAGQVATVLGKGGYWISNRNSPEQTTVGVLPAAVAEVRRRLAEAGLRVKVLDDVPHPYHTPVLEPAARRLRRKLERMDFAIGSPGLPVLSAVTGAWIDSRPSRPQMIDLLSRQLTAPGDFVTQVETAWRAGCGAFLELGPGRVLSNFAASILERREHRVLDLDPWLPRPAGAVEEDHSAKAGSPVFRLLQRAIARLTGYELLSIEITDRFQEDLGIDSIKKAEILVEVVEQAGIESRTGLRAAGLDRLADVVDALEKPTLELEAEARTARFDRLGEELEERRLPTLDIRPPPARILGLGELAFESGALDAGSGEVVIVRADRPEMESPATGTEQAVDEVEGLAAACRSLRCFARREPAESCVVLVTSPRTRPVLRGLAAALRSLAKELPGLHTRHLVIDEPPSDADLTALVARELRDGRATEARWIGGKRFVPRLTGLPRARGELPGAPVVVAFGGAKGIGLSLLRELCAERPARLWIGGRSAARDVAAAIQDLRGGAVRVEYRQLDARRPDQARGLVDEARRRDGAIDAVINAVGREHSAPLSEHDDEQICGVLATKILAASAIARAADGAGARRCLHFASIAGRYGNAGQAPYAAANQAITEMCRERWSAGTKCRHIAVNWPPWDSVGMTAKPGITSRLRQLGLGLLGRRRAWELMRQELIEPSRPVVDYACAEDRPLYELALADSRPWRPILGEPRGTGFRRSFDLAADPWLADHRLDGRALVPAAAALLAALAIGELLDRKLTRISGFKVLNALPVDRGGARLDLGIRPSADGLELRGDSAMPFFRALVEPLAELPPAPIPEVARWLETPYRSGGFFHGPAFQMLHRVGESANGELIAQIETRRLEPLTGSEPIDRLLLWLDGAFQLLAFHALRRRLVTIPTSVEALSVDLGIEPGAVMTLVASPESDGDGVCGDISLVRASGHPVLSLRGVRCSALKQ